MVKKTEDNVYSFRQSTTCRTDGQTDGQTDTSWWHRPRLCIASRVKSKLENNYTSAILIAEIRKAPDVGQINREADNGQKEVDLLAPHLAFCDLNLISA